MHGISDCCQWLEEREESLCLTRTGTFLLTFTRYIVIWWSRQKRWPGSLQVNFFETDKVQIVTRHVHFYNARVTLIVLNVAERTRTMSMTMTALSKCLILFFVVTCGNGEQAGIGDMVLITYSAVQFERLQALIGGGSGTEKYLGKEMEVVSINLNLHDSYVNTPCYLRTKHAKDGTYHSIHPETITSVTTRTRRPQLDNPLPAQRITSLAEPRNSPTQMSPTRVPVRPSDASELRTIPFEQITLEKKLGSGNFGTVYLAKCNRTRCAVKQIQAQDIIQGRERDRILQEAVTHRLLNIVIRSQIVTPSSGIDLRGRLPRHLEAIIQSAILNFDPLQHRTRNTASIGERIVPAAHLWYNENLEKEVLSIDNYSRASKESIDWLQNPCAIKSPAQYCHA